MAEFDPQFELDVVVQAAKDPNYRKRARRILNGFEFGDPRHQWLWGVVCKVGSTDVLTSKVAGPEIDRLKDDQQDEYLSFTKKALSRTVAAPSVTLERLSAYVFREGVRGAIHQVLDVMDDDDLTDAEQAAEIKGLLRTGLRGNDVESYRYVDVYEGFAERQKQREERRRDPSKQIRIPTVFMPSLDRDLEGGILGGELGLIAGTTGRGKSQVAMALAVSSAKRRNETVLIGTEMTEDQNALRADASVLRTIGQIALSRSEFTPEEYEELLDKFHGFSSLEKRLRIVGIPVMRCTMSVIEQVLDDAEDDWGASVKLLVMDSGDHIKPAERAQDRRNRESQAYWELKSLALERGIAIWSPTHAAKDVVNKLATAENVGESYDKSRIADIFVSLNANERQRLANELVVRNGKNRRGGRGAHFRIEALFDNVTFVEKADEPDTDPEEDDDPEDDS